MRSNYCGLKQCCFDSCYRKTIVGATGATGQSGLQGATGPTGPAGNIINPFTASSIQQEITSNNQQILFSNVVSPYFLGIGYNNITSIYTVQQSGRYQFASNITVQGIAIPGANERIDVSISHKWIDTCKWVNIDDFPHKLQLKLGRHDRHVWKHVSAFDIRVAGW